MNTDALRDANRARLPQFRNSMGEPAHTTRDGSDWTFAQWLQAKVGEIGEAAEVRMAYESGRITAAEYEELVTKELADVFIYGDILAMRALDVPVPRADGAPYSAAQTFMHLMCALGLYANARKKYDRGDITAEQFTARRQEYLTLAEDSLWALRTCPAQRGGTPADRVAHAHPIGINLGLAVIDKFNETSRKVGSDVFMENPFAVGEHF